MARTVTVVVALAVAWAAASAAHGRSFVDGAVGGLFYGVGAGAFWLIRSLRRRAARLRAAPLTLSLAQRVEANEASTRGPAPADPVVRAEALRILVARRADTAGSRIGLRYVGPVLTAAFVLVGLLSVWFLVDGAVFGALTAWSLWEFRRERRRLDLLATTS